MDLSVQWWHWLALGLLLVGAELIVPSFTIFGSGLVPVSLVCFCCSFRACP